MVSGRNECEEDMEGEEEGKTMENRRRRKEVRGQKI